MEVKISNEHLEKDNGNLRLFQPRYYFGQLLVDRKGQSGIVVEMGVDTGWYYLLLAPKTNKLLEQYDEDKLVAAFDEELEHIALSSMEIKISNRKLEDNHLKLRFTQPKYYFGQLLKDVSGFSGVVVQMGFKGEWEYELLELTTQFPPIWELYPEHQLVAVEPSLLTQK